MFKISNSLYAPARYVKTYGERKRVVSESLEILNTAQKWKKKILYFGVPMHQNLGDIAKTYCAIKWCKENYPKYQILAFQSYACYDSNFVKLLKNETTDDDLIIFQSGYCTKETHRDQPMHKTIVKNFPGNRILVLPQTVNFKDQKEYEKTVNIYNNHKRIIFLARDKVLYDSVKTRFHNIPVYLFSDIVTSLIGTYTWSSERNGVLLCVRNDFEKLYSTDQINKIFEFEKGNYKSGKQNDPFLRAFLKNLISRSCCSECLYATRELEI